MEGPAKERKIKINQTTVEVVQADITVQDTDAIVNAANKALAPGGGVAGAIHRAAGPELYQECRTLGGCETGEAKITKGYRLPAKYVIHTVGPVYKGSDMDAELLTRCYRNSIELAARHTLKSISFPAISTGVFGYPMEEAARVAINAVVEAVKEFPEIQQIRFVLYDAPSFEIFYKTLSEFG